MKLFVNFLLVFFFSISLLSAQHGPPQSGGHGGHSSANGMISGKIIDKSTRRALEYVSISITNEKGELVKGSVTDQSGIFIIKKVPFGHYKLECRFIGYQPTIKENIILSKNRSEYDLGKISLKIDSETLSTVEIVGDKAAIRYELDKKIIDVSNLNTAASQSALEVLETVPSVTVDIDGNVSLRGSSSFTLLIDGQPTSLEVQDALKTIPASAIKDIEIITNPSAKYDAEGTSGFINIIMKKNSLEGLSALINANVGNYNNYGGNTIIDWNTNKFGATVGGNIRKMNHPAELTSIRRTTFNNQTREIASTGPHTRQHNMLGTNLELTFRPNPRNIIIVNGKINKFTMLTALDIPLTEKLDDVIVSETITKEQTDRIFDNKQLGINYQYLFQGNKKHYLQTKIFINNFYADEDGRTNYFEKGSDVQFGGTRNTEIGPSNLRRFNLDYSNTFENGNKLELGTQFQFGRSDDLTHAFVYNPTSMNLEEIDSLSTTVDYFRNIFSGYGIFGGQKEKFSYQIGLRAEQTVRNVTINGQKTSTNIKRLDWFPSAHTSYQWSESLQLMANYSRRISRPRSWFLEPFFTWRDAYNIRQGNPDLLPQYIDSYELGFIKDFKKGSISTELYHRTTHNLINRVKSVYSPSVFLTRPENVGTDFSTGLEVALNNKLFKWWKSNLSLNAFNYQIKGNLNDEVYENNSNSWTLRWSNNFSLPKDFQFQLVTKYNSEIVTAQGITSSFFTSDISLKKQFFDSKLTAILQGSNIFSTSRRETYFEGKDFYYYFLRVPSAPMISLSLSFKINNYSKRLQRERSDEF